MHVRECKISTYRVFRGILAVVLVFSMVFGIMPPIKVSAAALNTPTITSPKEGKSYDGTASIVFKWGAVTGAKYYKYAIKDMTTGELLKNSDKYTSKSVTLSKSSILPNHEIKFAVGAYKTETEASDWASVKITTEELLYDIDVITIDTNGDQTMNTLEMSARINIDSNYDIGGVTVGFESGIKGGTQKKTNDTTKCYDGDEFGWTLTGLTASKTYTYRGYAIDPITYEYIYGNRISITTLDESDYKPEVYTDYATDITTTSAVINGELEFTADLSTEYGFIMGSGVAEQIKVGSSTKTTSFKYRWEYLQPNTQYTYKTYAKNKYGTVYGKERTFITDVEAVPQIISVTYDSPTIVENTDVTYTIKVLGEADKVELWVDSYNVAMVSDYLTSGSYRIFTSDVSIQNPGTRVFKAIAYNGTIASEPYTMDIVVEEAALPELGSVTIMQPTNGSVLREGDSLLVKWSAPANVSSVDKYIVKVWSDVSKKYTYTNNITQNSVDIGSYYLQDVGSYSISITAIKSSYEPSESIAYFDVEEGTKVLPKPAISSPSSYGSYDAGKDLTFSWSKVSGATKYYYKVTDITDGEPGATVLSGTTDNLSVTVAGDILLAGHVICLSVYAWSSTNESEESCAYAVIVKSDVSINVSVEELDFESAADYKTIKLTSSNSWTATASESWITLDKYSGSSDSNIKISVSKNISDRVRWGFVEFEDSTGSVIVEVYQATSSSAYD